MASQLHRSRLSGASLLIGSRFGMGRQVLAIGFDVSQLAIACCAAFGRARHL
jgi:hypothetical protein